MQTSLPSPNPSHSAAPLLEGFATNPLPETGIAQGLSSADLSTIPPRDDTAPIDPSSKNRPTIAKRPAVLATMAILYVLTFMTGLAIVLANNQRADCDLQTDSTNHATSLAIDTEIEHRVAILMHIRAPCTGSERTSSMRKNCAYSTGSATMLRT